MITFQRVLRKVLISVDWVDLALLVLNTGIGLAITNYLGYELNWPNSVFLILWIIFLYLGNGFLGYNQKQDSSEIDITFQRLMAGVFQLLAVLFLSLSIIPMIQIIIVSFGNYLAISLVSILSIWLLVKAIIERRIQIFGLSESISSFVISFVTPLMALNINGIQIHEILLPISFFSFLQIIANKLLSHIFELDKGSRKPDFVSPFIGVHTILRTVSVLILFGYLTCLSLFYFQDRPQLFQPLWFSIPISAFFVLKIFHSTKNQSQKVFTLKPLALVSIFYIEATWIIGLWIH